jgi:hypothetical protein
LQVEHTRPASNLWLSMHVTQLWHYDEADLFYPCKLNMLDL